MISGGETRMLSERKRVMQRFYDSAAPGYVRRDEGLKQTFHNGSEFIWLAELPLQDQRILDVGTGTGRLFRFVQDRGHQTALSVGVDLSSQMLLMARARTGEHCRTCFVQCDAEALPFNGDSFHLVTCFGLFEYIADLRPFLREFNRVTVPKGWLLFTCRNIGRLLPFPNRFYPVADHERSAVQKAVQECGYSVLRHKTIYHLNGRWIWALTSACERLGCDAALLRFVMAINRALRNSPVFGTGGKTHLVLAQRS